MTTSTQALHDYLECFTEFEAVGAGQEYSWLRELRRKAFARFCEVGFPTIHDEDWRFTDVSAVSKGTFRLGREGRSEVSPQQLSQWRLKGAACQLVFVDGHFALELSILNKLADNVRVAGLANELRSNSRLIEQHCGRYLDTQRDSFSALNTAFAEDGAYINVSRGVVVEEPICLLFVSTSGTPPVMSHPRNLILMDDDSQATIVEEYVSLGSGSAFCNAVTELVAADNTVVSHYRIEREQARAFNVSTLRIQQGRSANIASHSVLLGGALVRNNVHPVLAGEGGECLINGLFLGNDNQHLDNYMLVEHLSPHCGSRQFYNGVLDDHAHGVFHGRIICAQRRTENGCETKTNRNLLLSDDAQIDTKPQLEIHADDVKCTHGATIGQIDEEALFYLRSRGIDEDSARHHLLVAFAGECLARMKEGQVSRHIEALVNRYVLQIANRLGNSNRTKGVAHDAHQE